MLSKQIVPVETYVAPIYLSSKTNFDKQKISTKRCLFENCLKIQRMRFLGSLAALWTSLNLSRVWGNWFQKLLILKKTIFNLKRKHFSGRAKESCLQKLKPTSGHSYGFCFVRSRTRPHTKSRLKVCVLWLLGFKNFKLLNLLSDSKTSKACTLEKIRDRLGLAAIS